MKLLNKHSENSYVISKQNCQCENSAGKSGASSSAQDDDCTGNPSTHLSYGKPVKWDVTVQRTEELLQEMGVAVLNGRPFREVTRGRYETEFLPTPKATQVDLRHPPKAPKVGNHSTSIQVLNDSLKNHCSLTLQEAADNCGFFGNNLQENVLDFDYFSKLSDEIILSIFKWMPKKTLIQCAQVCKRWKRLAYDETLWRHLDLGRKHLQQGVLGTVLGRGVVYLRLAMTEVKPPIFASPNLNRFSKLQGLDLSMAMIPVSALEELLHMCAHLKKLSLEQCILSDDICRHIAMNKNLETLNMAMCSGVTTYGITTIGTLCQKLQSWNLSWMHLTSEAVNKLVRILTPSLKRINLSGCRSTLTDEHVQMIVTRCQHLVELDVSDAPLLTGETILHVATHLGRLERLCISRCYGITPVYYLQLKEIATLQHLEVFGIPNGVLQALRTNLPHVNINKNIFSTIARPTTGVHRTSIWGIKMR